MAALTDCIKAVQAASGDTLSRNDALDLLEQVRRRREQLHAAGTVDRMDRRLRELVAADAEKAQLLAALARKHAVLSAIARRRAQDLVLAHVNAGMSYRRAVLALLEGTERNVAGGRVSVAATNLAYEARYLGGLMGRIAKEKPHLQKRLGDDKLMADATRLMFGEQVADADPDAAWLAKTLREYSEMARLDLNQLGANIGSLDGWVPQGHMDWRLLRIERADWVKFIKPLLDHERTFGDGPAEAADELLGEIYDTITLGRDIDKPRSPSSDRFYAPTNVARSLSKHRVLHFADANSYMAYNQRFGFGNLFTAMESHLRKSARLAAQMDVLGPNPGSTLDSLLDGLISRVRGDDALGAERKARIIKSLQRGQSNAEGGRGGTIGSAYAVVSGLSQVPDDWNLAQAGSTFRALQSMAKLGSAVITAVSDVATSIINLTYHGRRFDQAARAVFAQQLAGRGKGEARAIAFGMGEGFDAILGHFTARYGVTDTMPGRVSRLMTHYFRWNGLSGWTDAQRAIAVRVMAADMGRLAGSRFDQLPAKYQRVLQQHGLNGDVWDVVRQTAWKGDNGTTYVTPDQLEALPAEAFDRLIAGELADVIAGVGAKIGQLRAAMAREATWQEGRIAKFEARAARIGDKIKALREQGAGARKLNDVQTARAAAFRDETGRAIDALNEAITAAKGELGDARALAKVGSARRAVTLAHGAGRNRGRAEANIGRARERLRQKLVAERQKLTAAERQLVDQLDAAAEDALSFLRESGRRQQARLDDIGFERAAVGRRIEAARSNAARRTAIALRRFYADEATFGVIEVDKATQRLVTGGSRPGTLGGEAIRMVMQFKGFPVAFGKRVLGRGIAGTEGKERAWHIAKLITTLTIAGYVSQAGKDFLRGREPKDPLRVETLLQAMMQSGAAGLYGDFLFHAGASRFGNTALETAAGPAVTTIADAINLYQAVIGGEATAKQGFDTLWQNVPGQNLWWLKSALDMAVLNEVRDALSARGDSVARSDRWAQEHYGQERILPVSLWR